jgi:hypothetical protein
MKFDMLLWGARLDEDEDSPRQKCRLPALLLRHEKKVVTEELREEQIEK